ITVAGPVRPRALADAPSRWDLARCQSLTQCSNGLSWLTMLVQGDWRYGPERYGDMIACMAALTGANESAFYHEIGEVARRGCRRCPSDADIFAGAQPALEPFRAFAQHAEQSLLLPVVKLIAQPIEQANFVDREFDQRDGPALSFDRCCRKPRE